MRKYTLAIVGIVATLSTLTSASQLSTRSLSTVSTTLDSASVNQIASQVEESVIGKLNQYFKVQTAPHAGRSLAESAHHDLPPNVMRQIGRYLHSELEAASAADAAAVPYHSADDKLVNA
jgi:hypothetical protein